MPDDQADDSEDIDALSEERDDVKARAPARRGYSRAFSTIPAKGRPVEIAHKARRALMRAKVFTVLTEAASGQREISPTQLKVIELLFDRGYGRAVDLQTHLHLLSAPGADTVGNFGDMSAAALTLLVRSLTSGAQTLDTAPMLQRVIDPPGPLLSSASPATSLATAEPKASQELDNTEVLPLEPTDT